MGGQSARPAHGKPRTVRRGTMLGGKTMIGSMPPALMGDLRWQHRHLAQRRSRPRHRRGRTSLSATASAGEGLITDKELAEKYEMDPAAWKAITKDVELGRAIRVERERRVLNGAAAREAAAKHFVKGPGILDQIMTAAGANPKHQNRSDKELRATAAIGSSAEGRPESEKFIIQIDLGGGRYPRLRQADKTRRPSRRQPEQINSVEGKI